MARTVVRTIVAIHFFDPERAGAIVQSKGDARQSLMHIRPVAPGNQKTNPSQEDRKWAETAQDAETGDVLQSMVFQFEFPGWLDSFANRRRCAGPVKCLLVGVEQVTVILS